MASQDFINLMAKLHTEGYKIISINRNAKRVGDSFSIEATVVLAKDEDRITLESSEADFIMYLAELRGVVDTNGEYEFKHVKNTKQYDADLEYLVDIDKSRTKKATEDIISGKFGFSYHPQELVDELLGNKGNIKKHLLPLKNDYHHILVAYVLQSKEMLKARELLMKKYPEAQKVVDGVERILMAFRSTGNAVSDYKFYRNFARLDVDELGERMSTQLEDADDIMKEFIKRRAVDTYISFPRMMNIYANFLEILSPMLNLVRIGLELRRGNDSPNKYYELVENIGILKSDKRFGHLFSCLDEQIRHASAHASFRINKAVRKVYLLDERGRKGKITRTYTFDQLTNILNGMNNEFFPVIYPTLVLFDIAMLDLLLVSREYKHLLLALGNI